MQMTARVLPDNAIGITTTVPVEVLYVAGRLPVDLNNIFVTGAEPHRDIAYAEQNGFPRTSCAWIKGLYGCIHRCGVKTVLGVTQGDCSDTHVLLEILEGEGIEVIPFAFPFRPDATAMQREIDLLCELLGTTSDAAESQKVRLDAARAPAHELDKCFARGVDLSGVVLFESLLNCSDFQGDPDAHAASCKKELALALQAAELPKSIRRLGLLGVPPVYTDLIGTVESREARIIFQEVPRQFALPYAGLSLAESYSRYTYPYSMAARLEDITQAIAERQLDGLIHYTQSFCHRQMQDRLLRDGVDIPVLTLEGDRPGPVEGSTRTRIEAFLEMLG
jgi:benzoyl-CoA reductase/2-hydroxyglutaryl-CoA dehydratase subunit BcrC/BadD/HgdB